MTAGRYLDLDLPEYFRLDTRDDQGNWLEWGRYFGKDFVCLDDGSYVCGGAPRYGSPTWFRCIAHHDGYFEHVDRGGRGRIHAYRLVPLPAPASDRTD